jgi:hypothetical protein
MLRDSFLEAFSTQRNLSAWRKCGAVPLTQRPMDSTHVCHEIPVGAAAQLLEEESEPNAAIENLKHLEEMNKFHCDMLNANGFNGDKLQLEAPKRKTYVAVTKAYSKERVIAIRKASTAGQMFFATGGRHINANEFFQANTLKSREADIKALEDKKADRKAYCAIQQEALKLIRKKGDLTWNNHGSFNVKELKMLLKWKKVEHRKTRKEDLVELYVKAEKPGITKAWTRTKEAELVKLKDPLMDMKHTALGVATTHMANAVCNNMANLATPERTRLLQSLQDYNDMKGPNCL